jgi:hypothetical protein
MMRRSSSIKGDIEKIKKLKALQAKATDKLKKIAEKAAVKPPKKKKAKPAGKRSALRKKESTQKKKTEKKSHALKTKNKRRGKKGPIPRAGVNEGFFFRHFGRGRG